MRHTDWIPTREQALVDLCRQWVLILGNAPNTARWGWNAQEVAATLGAINDFLSARDTFEITRSDLHRVEKDEKKAIAIARMRSFANTSIRFNAKMATADRMALGIHPRDMEPTRHPAPDRAPEVVADTSVLRRLRLRARDFGSRTWGRPAGVEGIQLRWALLDARPDHIDALSIPVSVSANPIDLVFDEEERGMRVFYAARWVNSTEGAGPWSDIESAFVP